MTAPDWTDDPTITKAAYDAMPQAERALVDCDPNKWEWDWGTERYYNVQHRANEDWAIMRQVAEVQAMLGR